MILERRARSCTMPGKMRGSSGLGSSRQGCFWDAAGSIVIIVVEECDRSRNVLLLRSPAGVGVERRSVLEWEPVNRASCAAVAADGDGEVRVLIRMRLEGDGGYSGEVGFACVGAGAGAVY